MKKIIFTFALALTAIVAGARVYVAGEDLEYKYDEEAKTATVVQCRATWKVDATHIDYYNTYYGDIVIPETAPNGYTVVAIGEGAFQRLNDSRFDGPPPTITSISIPKTVKTIGNSAFAYCNLLTSFTIPATIEEIGNSVFYGSGITTITIEDADTPLLIGSGHMSNLNVLGAASALTTVYAGRDITPTSTQNLGPFQFSETITDITYGPKVTKLNKHEFWRCKTIKNVKILSTQVTVIPESAFGECSALETVELPQTIVAIEGGAFLWCNALRNIVLPPVLKTIGNQTFDGCILTPEFTIPASVEEIGNVAFKNSAITHLTIEDSDKPLTIGYGTTSDITMLGGMFSQPCTVYAGRDITYGGDFGPFRHARNISEITYGPKVTKLNYYEAQSCESLEKVVCLSEKITEIPEAAFANCSKLASVELPARLETIGKQAFTSTALTTVTIPSTVKNIYDFAFISSPLETINAMPTWPPLCVYNVFANGANRTIYDNCRLMVPKGSLEDYKAADVWKEFFNIEEMEPEADPEPTLTQGVLAVTRLADMNNARISHQILPTSDGFAVFGGHVTGFSLTRSAERYSTATGTWTNMEMLYPQDYSGSIIMPDGRLFIMGGMSSGSGVGASSQCEFYDPATNTFSAAASMVQPRSQLHATMSKSGKIYINGCWYNSSTGVECYDPETQQFTKVGEGLKTHLPFIFAMRGEKVVVTGGNSMVVLENGETTNVESELLTAYPIMKSWHESRMADHQIADYSYVAVGRGQNGTALLHIFDDATEGIRIEKIADLPQTLPNDAQAEIEYANEVTRVFCKPAERKVLVQTNIKGDGQRPVIVEYTFPSANKLEDGSTVVYTLVKPLENTIHDAAWASLADGTFVATGGGNSNFSPHAATYIFSLKKAVQGDTNGDGVVDVADIAFVIDMMAKSIDATANPQGDVNDDGVIDVADIATIIDIMARN